MARPSPRPRNPADLLLRHLTATPEGRQQIRDTIQHTNARRAALLEHTDFIITAREHGITITCSCGTRAPRLVAIDTDTNTAHYRCRRCTRLLVEQIPPAPEQTPAAASA